MRIVINKTLLFCFIGLLSFTLLGQQKESDKLKQQQKELENKISFTENLLKSTTDDKLNLSKNISLINHKIEYREALLNNISVQLKTLNTNVLAYQNEIELLSAQVLVLEEQYKKMIVQAYKMRSETASVFFIISAANYNQANKRMVYLSQITKYRADQIYRIKQLRNQIQNNLLLLEDAKTDQQVLKESKQREKNKYLKDRALKIENINSLTGKEKLLQDELLAQKKKSDAIKRAISKAINKEIADAQKKAKATPKTIKETKEIALNNSGFEANKGRLPWPVSKGEITKGFGKQAHPLHPGVYTYNSGLDITTVKGATVRAVYAGVVSSIINIPGAGKAIIIAHGNYRTIYSNLQEVYVQKGDKVLVKQEMGALLIQTNGSVSEVHFEIRKITDEGQIDNLNPAFWLYQ
ncbi:hypothetical protein DNU06_12580 [Putridiphycobacter roseus]|uniref:M23ase beta-sheet core domain-containing protein n=1 Tax=Putridiphycobacter roseus TaxID=2219161 RepID=A0A2W1MZ65_9FLAO|nr:peptidoglycan DD-metalloendopeptidase family protein [Putridiphycobacter roseus]PZE16684.1 hypothetical protein DNU06_12580 [Putridiphycobacter roseus]